MDCDNNPLCTINGQIRCSCSRILNSYLRYCNPSTIIPGCETDEDCPELTPYCSSSNLCAGTLNNGCSETTDCPNALPMCVTSTGVCQPVYTGCTSSYQCFGSHPFCNVDTGYCYPMNNTMTPSIYESDTMSPSISSTDDIDEDTISSAERYGVLVGFVAILFSMDFIDVNI